MCLAECKRVCPDNRGLTTATFERKHFKLEAMGERNYFGQDCSSVISSLVVRWKHLETTSGSGNPEDSITPSMHMPEALVGPKTLMATGTADTQAGQGQCSAEVLPPKNDPGASSQSQQPYCSERIRQPPKRLCWSKWGGDVVYFTFWLIEHHAWYVFYKCQL